MGASPRAPSSPIPSTAQLGFGVCFGCLLCVFLCVLFLFLFFFLNFALPQRWDAQIRGPEGDTAGHRFLKGKETALVLGEG